MSGTVGELLPMCGHEFRDGDAQHHYCARTAGPRCETLGHICMCGMKWASGPALAEVPC